MNVNKNCKYFYRHKPCAVISQSLDLLVNDMLKDLDVSFVNGHNITKKYLGIKGLPYKAMLAMNYITAIKKL